ncbi:MAG: FADH2 O2-dependent halogenase I, partial [Hyphomonadaceae bacterium]
YVTTMDIPDTLGEKLDIYKGQAKILADYYDLFRPMSWISVLAGMEVIPKNSNPIINIVPPEFSINILRDVSAAIADGVAKAPSHESFLKQLTG